MERDQQMSALRSLGHIGEGQVDGGGDLCHVAPGHVGNGEERYEVGNVTLNEVKLISLIVNGEERVCLAQLSNTLLKDYSYNEIHNRRVALGITCVQCTPLQLEVLRRSGAMPMSSRRCGMITRREAERLYKSFFNEIAPPNLPSDFVFSVYHHCGWGCNGYFIPSRYNSSRAKCIRCAHCSVMFSPNKFIFHCHQTPTSTYIHPDAANFNSWRRHIKLTSQSSRAKDTEYAWEDVKALFNGGSRKRTSTSSPLEPELSPLPSKISNMFVGKEGTTSVADNLSKSLHSAMPNFTRHQIPPSANYSLLSANIHSFLRGGQDTVPPMWPQTHQATLNEILHRTRLFSMGLVQPPLPNPPHMSRSTLQYNPAAVSSDEAKNSYLKLPGFGCSSTSKSDTRQIKRPWLDSKEAERITAACCRESSSGINTMSDSTTSLTTSLTKSLLVDHQSSPPIPKGLVNTIPSTHHDTTAQSLLKAFLSQVEDNVM